ncbi:uroporphyrinogen-III synthase [Helicobacter ibis]|uniref:Uroporphyrinogen-III synthase n=1 Tax=Helicobacter ibis TaxID=2962633 RepID=A0ABT4VDY3_9HELI|nr:uroporphyrinogen-III synthase [Helicobacter ibis]MDA3968915.1 uroporphyrinogen-III synthase [Helicobacter ibis]
MKMVYYITKQDSSPYDSLATPLRLLDIQVIIDTRLEDKLLYCDSLIFTSKNSVLSLEAQINHTKWAKIPTYCLGNASKRELERLQIKPYYVSKSPYGDEFAFELVGILKNKNPLFIRAKKVASNLYETLRDNGINIVESVLYETSFVILEDKVKLDKNSVIFFSSPSGVEAFLFNYNWHSSYIALCIGKTTYEFAQSRLHNANIIISPSISIEESLKYAKNDLC